MDNIKELLTGNIQKLTNSKDIDENENLLAYGLNSISIIKLISLLKQENIIVSFVDMIKNPTISDWTILCQSKMKSTFDGINNETNAVVEETPFPMTDIQKAYFFGRGTSQPLGGVSCHAYVEFTPEINIDTNTLINVWKKLFSIHPSLRSKFSSDGYQQIVSYSPSMDEVKIYDLTNLNADEKEKELLLIRDKHSHNILDVENARVIELAISKLDDSHVRIHIGLDLLIADVISFKIIIDDLTDLYNGISIDSNQKWSFKDYLEIQKKNQSKNKKIDELFWKEEIKNITPGSLLPLKQRPETISNATYYRLSFNLNESEYDKLKQLASKYNTTIAMIFMTCYAKAIQRFSSSNNVLINIPLFNRDLSIKGTDRAVADFTDLVLLNIDLDNSLSFMEQVKLVQKHFYECYNHSCFTGTEVLKLISATTSESIIAPIVFSCTEGMEQFSTKCTATFGKPGFIITQTPQVFIDFQIFQSGNDLMCTWDVPKNLFHDSMIKEMFYSLKMFIKSFVLDTENPDINKHLALEIPTLNIVENKDVFLHSGFYENVRSRPDAIALIDSETGEKYTYASLSKHVAIMANALIIAGVKPNDRVCLTIDRGPKEVISILAILSAGATYLPLTKNQPKERREKAINTMYVKYAIVDENELYTNINTIMFVDSISNTDDSVFDFEPKYLDSDSAAYIILTSGTTGIPKGVEISHKGAMNTIIDVNKRINFTNQDVVLAVSSIDFDLSVYDMFGTFSGGGTLVVTGISHYRDALFWNNTLSKYNISIWNSVPLIFEMLLTVIEDTNSPLHLRAVMLSGDWISSELYNRVAAINSTCRFIGMGGATEASIWSNWYEIKSKEDLRSNYIPYGFALNNQAYRIINSDLLDCPHYVTGELLIGGIGLAIDYCEDEKKTKEKFIYIDGQRWYRTGDKGYFEDDGCIIFKGRIDNQCKVRGHRIELGEIETNLQDFYNTQNVICIPCGNENAYNHIEACIFDILGTDIDTKAGIDYLKSILPPYMVPTVIHFANNVPLTSNGKADRRKIKELFADSGNSLSDTVETTVAIDNNATFITLKELWCNNLNISDATSEDNYYFSGGDSLKAIKLSSEINKTFNLEFTTMELLETQTLGELFNKIYQLISYKGESK